MIDAELNVVSVLEDVSAPVLGWSRFVVFEAFGRGAFSGRVVERSPSLGTRLSFGACCVGVGVPATASVEDGDFADAGAIGKAVAINAQLKANIAAI